MNIEYHGPIHACISIHSSYVYVCMCARACMCEKGHHICKAVSKHLKQQVCQFLSGIRNYHIWLKAPQLLPALQPFFYLSFSCYWAMAPGYLQAIFKVSQEDSKRVMFQDCPLPGGGFHQWGYP